MRKHRIIRDGKCFEEASLKLDNLLTIRWIHSDEVNGGRVCTEIRQYENQ